MNKTLVAALLGATLLTGAAQAQQAPAAPPAPPPPPHAGALMRADANHDGVVTRAEWLAAVDARFARLDADKDGKITPDERRAAHRRPGGPDGDRPMPGGPMMRHGPAMPPPPPGADRTVTLDQERAQATRLFDFIDQNRDGRIDAAEIEAARATVRPLMGPDGPRPGRFGRHHGPGAPGEMPPPPPPPGGNPGGADD